MFPHDIGTAFKLENVTVKIDKTLNYPAHLHRFSTPERCAKDVGHDTGEGTG